MGKLFIVGGMGAIINCAFSSAFSLELLFRDLLVEPIAAVRTLLPAALGFLFGTLVVLVWNFLRAMVIRFLLDYNGWFLSKHRPINKVCPYISARALATLLPPPFSCGTSSW